MTKEHQSGNTAFKGMLEWIAADQNLTACRKRRYVNAVTGFSSVDIASAKIQIVIISNGYK